MRNYPQPLWNGEKLSSGRLLLWGEQGVGGRSYVCRTCTRGDSRRQSLCARLRSSAPILFARSFPEIEVVTRYDPTYAPGPEIAAHLPSGSLPSLLRRSSAAFAATASPYLFADAMARQRLRQRYADGRRVIGLAWHTNTARPAPTVRSIFHSSLRFSRAPIFAGSACNMAVTTTCKLRSLWQRLLFSLIAMSINYQISMVSPPKSLRWIW